MNKLRTFDRRIVCFMECEVQNYNNCDIEMIKEITIEQNLPNVNGAFFSNRGLQEFELTLSSFPLKHLWFQNNVIITELIYAVILR